MHPCDIERVSQVLSLGPNTIQQLNDRYVLMSLSNNVSVHDCPIHEIVYDDFIRYNNLELLRKLKYLERKYSDTFCKVFPRGTNSIERKVYNTICFAFDKVYKCDKICVVFNAYNREDCTYQGVPNAIYKVLQDKFDILHKSENMGVYNILIQRKEVLKHHGINASRNVY